MVTLFFEACQSLVLSPMTNIGSSSHFVAVMKSHSCFGQMFFLVNWSQMGKKDDEKKSYLSIVARNKTGSISACTCTQHTRTHTCLGSSSPGSKSKDAVRMWLCSCVCTCLCTCVRICGIYVTATCVPCSGFLFLRVDDLDLKYTIPFNLHLTAQKLGRPDDHLLCVTTLNGA